ncbi:hypothetical protein [Dickeya dadantii]|uniref:hypothetical protein n=1 Tax=Dickeya dadantii TaxID=204038 RepID=UPI0003A06A39|nr:hypothetical protein [Dickeya dadantii]
MRIDVVPKAAGFKAQPLFLPGFQCKTVHRPLSAKPAVDGMLQNRVRQVYSLSF